MSVNIGYKRVFKCKNKNCDDVEMDFKDFINHAKCCHGVKIKGVKGSRVLSLHINRRPRHMSIYDWDVNGYKFTEINK